jgi:hypothetical protein
LSRVRTSFRQDFAMFSCFLSEFRCWR